MSRRLNFGGDPNPFGESGPPRSFVNPLGVVELEGAYPPPPVPASYPPTTQTAQVVEPVEGWWRQKGAFGFGFNGPVPGEGEVISLTEQLHLPGPPREWWIHWFRYNRNVAGEGNPFNYELRGRITYGVGGVQNIVECDVIQGVQLPVIANSLKIELVTYNPTPDVLYDTANGNVVVGGMFGDGAGGGALPATWTTESFIVPGALLDLAVDVPLPDFARSVCLHTTEPNPANLGDVQLFFNTGSVTIKSVIYGNLYDALTREKGIAIPAGTNQIRLFAPGATQAGERFTLQFFLAL